MHCKTDNASRTQAKISRRPISPLIFILTIICSFPGMGRSQSAPLQIRLEKALENARAITNIEIQYDDVLWLKGTPGAPPPLTNDYTRTEHITYTAADEKYRVECRTDSPDTTNIVKFTQTAFDGELWSEFNADTSYMVEQDGDRPNDLENPYNPLIQPFLFLSKSSDDFMPGALRFVDLRAPDILNDLILPDTESSNGVFHLSFPGLPRNGVNQLWGIAIHDTDPDFTPETISTITYAGGKSPYDLEATCNLSDYTNLGAYHFPTKLAYSMYIMPTNRLLVPTLMATGMVTMVSVKIPAEIPASTFRLDESKALHIWNWGEAKGFGVGLVLGEAGSNIMVKRVILDSPAGAQNKIHTGDLVLSIAESNGPTVPVHAGKGDLPRAIARLQGAKGSKVELTIVPSGKDDLQAQVVTLVRGKVGNRIGGGQVLTNGMKAPDIEMVALPNGITEHLSDYAGKIVVLEFWASWCPPCQKSMADFQLDLTRYPNWKHKVVLIAASVDDTANIATKRIQEKGWNQTHNVWLKTKDLQSYPLGGIPYAYVIDTNGNIAASGTAMEERLNIPDIVNQHVDAAR
jgi:thiol-disulfide isomerase/thioredoxin